MADPIINLGILAHADAGKTTITEQLLLAGGAIRQAGDVDEGTTQTDWLDVERLRGISVRSASTVLRCAGVRVQVGKEWSGRMGFPMMDARDRGISPGWEDYPMFSFDQMLLERAVGVAYEQRFRSLLAYVNDRPEAVEALGRDASLFREAADYVEANGVRVTGALVYAEAGALLRLWENGDVDKISIDTVLPSRYSADGEFGW